MNPWKISALFGVALLATTAFAANKASVQVDRAVTVNGKQLTPGKYTVTWEGTGPNVDLSIARRNDVVVKTAARVVDLPKALATDALITKTNTDGSASLSQIQFGGKKYVLEIGESQTDTAMK